MNTRIPVATTLVAVCLSMAAAALEPSGRAFTGSSKKTNDVSAALRCRLCTDQKRLADSLEQAGWPTETKGQLPVDWKSQVAVVIAPQLYRQDHRIAYDGLDRSDPAKFTVVWNLRPGAPDLPPAESRPGSRSEYSTGIGPEILVVVLPRELLAGRRMTCKGPKQQ